MPASAAREDYGPPPNPPPPPHPLLAARSRVEKGLISAGVIPTGWMTLPHFIGIGAQKSGTTWMWHNLRSHPEVYVAKPKELHYWDVNYHQTLWSYARRFRNARGRVRGEVTPTYTAIQPDRIALMRKVMPDLRLIFLLRNPIERGWSHVRHVIRKQNLDPAALPKEWYLQRFRGHGHKQGDYLTALRNWEAHFPREQMYVGFFEDVENHPQQLLREVFRHIGVSEEVDWDQLPWNEGSNVGLPIPLPEEFRETLIDIYRDEIYQLAERFGDRAARWIPK